MDILKGTGSIVRVVLARRGIVKDLPEVVLLARSTLKLTIVTESQEHHDPRFWTIGRARGGLLSDLAA